MTPGARPSGPSRREPPSAYPAGSQEEQWSLEIVGKGRVTCPTCRTAGRKTVEGLKKHMANCHQGMFTCNHCGKRLRSQAGMKYHIMADHGDLLSKKEDGGQEEPNERDHLRMVLKRMGKLKCTRQGCTGSFTSVLGYLYHTQKCGKADSELEEMLLNCHHCNKAYRSKAGLVYHLKSEHGPVALLPDDGQSPLPEDTATEPSSGGRVQRRSAKVAAYYLHELASAELVKEWPKRKVLQDLVPDDRKLKYTRPGLPAVSQEDLGKWRSEIKMSRRLRCPNQGCESIYASISGLRSHLGSCTLGGFALGKYKCLLCSREFVSESGVKYHIHSVHAEDWFDVNPNPARKFEALMTLRQKEPSHRRLPPRNYRRQLSPVVRKKLTRLVAEQGSAIEDPPAVLRHQKGRKKRPAAGQGRRRQEHQGCQGQGGKRLGGGQKKVQ